MLGGVADDFVGNASDDRQQNDALGEASRKGSNRDEHVNDHGNDHHGHQKTCAAPRMISRIFLDGSSLERIAVLECVDRFVLSAVILVDAANIFPERNSPDEEQEERNSNQAIDEIEDELLAKDWIHMLQLGCGDERKVLVHEDEERDGKDNVYGRHPASDLELLRRDAGVRSWIFFIFVEREIFEHCIGGKLQCAKAKGHGVAKRHDAADYWPAHPLVLIGGPCGLLAMSDDLTGRLSDGDPPGMRRAHHDALEHSLTADEGFLSALKSGKQLHCCEETYELAENPHSYWLDVAQGKDDPRNRVTQAGLIPPARSGGISMFGKELAECRLGLSGTP